MAIALKYADKDETPVGYYDVEKGFMGYALKANLDGKDGDEYIIPYTKKSQKPSKHSKIIYSHYKEYCLTTVCLIVRGKRKEIYSFTDQINPMKCPKIYMTVEGLIKEKLPVLFITDNSWEGSNGVTNIVGICAGLYEDVFPGQEIKDNSVYLYIENIESMLIPWEYIFHQFDSKSVTYNSFVRDGPNICFDVRGLTKGTVVGQKSIDKEKLAEFQKIVDYYYHGKNIRKK